MNPTPPSIELVDGPAAVSLAWLDAVLAGAGVAPAGSLRSFEGRGIGTGKVGEIIRYTLGWADGVTAPRSVVGKFAATDPLSRRAGIMTGTYVREVSFYRNLAHTVQLALPACHGVGFEPQTGNFVLVLEDLTPAQQGDQLKGCTVDEAALALQELAGLHAPHWGNPALEREGWLAVRANAAAGLGDIYDRLVDAFAAHYADRLAPEVIDTARRLRGRVPRWLALDTPPLTLLHGDYRCENLLFGAPAARFALAVVDWQTVMIGPGLSDVAYFLGASLPSGLRRQHESELLYTYLGAMSSRGVELDWQQSWNQYRAHAFAGLHTTVVASQLVGRDPRSDEMFAVMAERHATHILELESLELLD